MPGNDSDNDTRLQLGRTGIKICIEVESKPYTNLDKALMDAAQALYCKSEKGEWKKEYGIAVYSNGKDFRLGKIIDGTEKKDCVCDNPNPEAECEEKDKTKERFKREVPMSDAMKEQTGTLSGYSFYAFMHSHTADFLSIYENEFSTEDYYQSMVGNNNKPFDFYLVVNVGTKGVLIKFMPPTNNIAFIRAVTPVFTDIGRALSKPEQRERLALLGKIRGLPRSTCVEVVSKMVDKRSACGARLKETPIIDGQGDDLIVDWKDLPPRIILWKSCVTTLAIRMVKNSCGGKTRKIDIHEKMLRGESDLIYTYDKPRALTYDLRDTVTKVIVENGVELIGYKEFAGFTALTRIEIQSNNLHTISIGAFSGCDKLKIVKIQSNNLKAIGRDAFSGCTKLTSITCLCPKPPGMDTNAFSGLSRHLRKKIRVFVPKDSVGVYSGAVGWSDFTILSAPKP